MKKFLQRLIYVYSVGLISRVKVMSYRFFGMQVGTKNRFEGTKCRAFNKIQIGNNNAFFGGGHTIWPLLDKKPGIKIRIKDGCMFNRNLYIDACGYVEIGNGCMVGPDVYITDANHQYCEGVSPRDLPMEIGKVIIGDNCWIGAKAIILKDVILGDNCVVAAGAVVNQSFGKGSVIGGVPAKLLKTIS